MGLVILVVCLGAALNVVLWGALYRKLATLPSRIASLLHRERSQAAAEAQAVLQEAAAAKVGALVFGLRTYHDQVEQNLRGQVAEAETRARVAERRAAEAAPLLGAASALAQEIRRTLEEVRSVLESLGPLAALFSELRAANEALCADEAAFAPATATPAPESGAPRETAAHATRETVPAGPDSDDARRSLGTLPPEGGAAKPAAPGEEDSGDELTVVATRPAIRPPPTLDEARGSEGRAGTPGDQPGGTAP